MHDSTFLNASGSGRSRDYML